MLINHIAIFPPDTTMANLLDSTLEQYIENHCTEESAVLSDLNRTTHLNFLMPQMLSGKVQGQFLKIISQMLEPQRVLEIGTYTGYSAICLSEGLKEKGLLYTIDINDELAENVKTYIERSSKKDQIKFLIGNALEVVSTLDEVFDLVFIDADKINYSNYFDLVIDKVRPGGYIMADNVLWSGKVVDNQQDKDTKALDAYNKKIQNDDRVENVIVSIRDGIMIARKL